MKTGSATALYRNPFSYDLNCGALFGIESSSILLGNSGFVKLTLNVRLSDLLCPTAVIRISEVPLTFEYTYRSYLSFILNTEP